MRIEEEHQDILQNIEFAVARLYRRNPEMTDYAVQRTYEALVQAYTAEITGRARKPTDPSGLEAELLRDVRSMCEWRLGRREMPVMQGDAPKCKPIDVPTLVLCPKTPRQVCPKVEQTWWSTGLPEFHDTVRHVTAQP